MRRVGGHRRREFTYCAETVCPTCNQDLPEDQIEEARQKALEAFNQSKAERLEENERQGHEIVKRKKALESDATKYRNEATLQQKKMQQMQARYEKIQSELSKMPSSMSVTDPEYQPAGNAQRNTHPRNRGIERGHLLHFAAQTGTLSHRRRYRRS